MPNFPNPNPASQFRLLSVAGSTLSQAGFKTALGTWASPDSDSSVWEPGKATQTPTSHYTFRDYTVFTRPSLPLPDRPRPETDPSQPPSQLLPRPRKKRHRGVEWRARVQWGRAFPRPGPAQQVRPGPTSPPRPRLLTPTMILCDLAARKDASSACSARPS